MNESSIKGSLQGVKIEEIFKRFEQFKADLLYQKISQASQQKIIADQYKEVQDMISKPGTGSDIMDATNNFFSFYYLLTS